jgi:hypothetical protein
MFAYLQIPILPSELIRKDVLLVENNYQKKLHGCDLNAMQIKAAKINYYFRIFARTDETFRSLLKNIHEENDATI